MSDKKPNPAIVLSTLLMFTITIILIGLGVSELIESDVVFLPFLLASGILPTILVQLIFYPKEETTIKSTLHTIFTFKFLNPHTLKAVKKETKKK